MSRIYIHLDPPTLRVQATGWYPEPGEKLGCVYRSLLPQRQYVPARCVTALRLPKIEFNMGGGTPDGYGVRMRDIVAMPKEVCIEDAENHVFSGTGRHALRLEISWPAYEEWVQPVKLYTDDGPITRRQLAAAIVDVFIQFIRKAGYEPIPIRAEWRVGEAHGGLVTDDLLLVSLVHLYDDVFQAVVIVEPRKR